MITQVLLGITMAAAPAQSEVTIYNQGFGLIKELRQMQIRTGRQNLTVEDVAAMIEPSSVSIRPLGAPDQFEVLEQNYQYDLIGPIAILNKSVGQRVRFIRAIGGQRDVLEGILMSAPTSIVTDQNGNSSQTYNGMVIKTDDGRIVLNPSGEIEVSSIPNGLISKPTLVWDILAKTGGTSQVELSYLTKGITWNADYVLTIDGSSKGALKGWVTLNNQCGKDFVDSKLKLLAGDVQRVMPQLYAPNSYLRKETMDAQAGLGFQEEALFEYHLYTLQRPATVRDKEIKQVSLLQSDEIAYTKKLIVDSMRSYGMYYPSEGQVGLGTIKPQVRVEFKNSLANGLGIPLPMGNFKVYQRDASGSVQMIGEDRIEHTPKDEKLSIVVGRSFDVVANRKRTEFRRIASNVVQESFEIEVRNHKETAESVDVIERHYGDWRIDTSNMQGVKTDSNTMTYTVNLKAGETKTITYTVTTRW